MTAEDSALSRSLLEDPPGRLEAVGTALYGSTWRSRIGRVRHEYLRAEYERPTDCTDGGSPTPAEMMLYAEVSAGMH